MMLPNNSLYIVSYVEPSRAGRLLKGLTQRRVTRCQLRMATK